MVSLKVVYQLVLIVWFGTLIILFSHISDLGYKEPANIQDIDFVLSQTTEEYSQNGSLADFELKGSMVTSTDSFGGTPGNVKLQKEEIVPQSLQCPLPEPSRVHPFCQENVVRLWDNGDHECFKKFGVKKEDDCSILSYLNEVERWCPLLPGKNESLDDELKPAKAELRKEIKGLFKILKHSYFKWMRNRISSWWKEWIKGVKAIKRTHNQRSRSRKKILVFLGAFAQIPTFFYSASSGGPLGELVQWTDLISTVYLLGHDLTVSAFAENLPELLGKPDKNGCIPEKEHKSSPRFDVIFTDITGVGFIKNSTGPLYSKYKCRLRVVDSFGTDAEFNYHGYRKPIPGGSSTWGKLDLDLRQFMTMFPHSPDNSFLGFVSGVKVNRSESDRINAKKRDQCLIYGKVLDYWRLLMNFTSNRHSISGRTGLYGIYKGHENYLRILRKYFDIHATTIALSKTEKHRKSVKLPGFVKNHGIVGYKVLMDLLQQSKVFVGLGFPYEGPAPLEAIANGAVFLNPKFDPPKNRVNTKFFKGKPTSRSLTSQSPYLEELVGKPYVYTIDIKNEREVQEALNEIIKTKISPFLPLEYTCEGMLERVDALIGNQNFCTGKLWPPLDKLRIVLGFSGQSCKDACSHHGRLCEPAYWEVINQKAFLRKFTKCQRFVSDGVLYAPSFNSEQAVCHLQDNVLLFSCVAKETSQQRLCPCRDFRKEQVALCEGCF